MRLTALVLVAATAGLLQWVSLPSSQPVGEAEMTVATTEPIEPVMLVNLSSQPDVGPGDEPHDPGPTPTPEPTIAPPPAEAVEAATNHDELRQRATLTEAEVREILNAAGFEGDVLEEAIRVAWGESRWRPAVRGDGGNAYGLFQIHPEVWVAGGVCDGPYEALLAALPNARCARLILEYEEVRGYPRWANWTVKP